MQKVAFVMALAASLYAMNAQGSVTAMVPAQLANPANVTVIEKNDVFPVLGPITVTPCAVEDCSDVAQGNT